MAIHQVTVAGVEVMEAVAGNKQLEGTTTLLSLPSHLKDRDKCMIIMYPITLIGYSLLFRLYDY